MGLAGSTKKKEKYNLLKVSHKKPVFKASAYIIEERNSGHINERAASLAGGLARHPRSR
jgi:hypothetical protein